MLWWAMALCGPAWAEPVALPGTCAPVVLSVEAARANANGAGDGPQLRPADGWEPVELPDVWVRRWPGHEGSVWYRIRWEPSCPAEKQAMGLGIDGMSMAGEVFLNDELLWRDASMAEPLSRSWNTPRWWLLPASGLASGVNTVWVRVVGLAPLSPGLGTVRLGSAAEVAREHFHSEWRQRTVYVFCAGLAAAVGCLFGVVWCQRRNEHAFGWYALMSIAWTAYVGTVLATTPWPFEETLAMSRWNIVSFVLYVVCFCLFTWRFGAQRMPRVERVLWGLAALGSAAVLLAPRAMIAEVFLVVWVGFVLIFFANCLQFQWHAWRPRPGGRNPSHMLLALCWLVFVVVGIHDLAVILNVWHARETWSAIAGPLTTVCMALLLGGRLVAGMRQIERFNHELEAHVAKARLELAQALQREHAQALGHAKLQERMEIAHDLHDGLGGSLVRSMALVEQASQPLPNSRVLSLFKVLRDDLRQVIDHGSSSGAIVPETPVRWAAPLRHRFTGILDEIGVASQWGIAPQWGAGVPSALQCLGLTRLVEEALSNVIKHSGARSLRVEVQPTDAGGLHVRIEDDGVGFDVAAVQHAGLSVGMRSMAARAERMGGALSVASEPGRTVVCVSLVL